MTNGTETRQTKEEMQNETHKKQKQKQTRAEAGRTAVRTWQAKQNGDTKAEADEPSACERARERESARARERSVRKRAHFVMMALDGYASVFFIYRILWRAFSFVYIIYLFPIRIEYYIISLSADWLYA